MKGIMIGFRYSRSDAAGAERGGGLAGACGDTSGWYPHSHVHWLHSADSVEKLVLLTVGMLAFGLVIEGLARHFS